MAVIKRTKRKEQFDTQKILTAIKSAFCATKELDETEAQEIAEEITQEVKALYSVTADDWSVEYIQDLVERLLMERKFFDTAKSYITYRYLHKLARDKYADLMEIVKHKLNPTPDTVANQNANVDEQSFGGRVGEVSRCVLQRFALENGMSEMARNNHLNNEIYIHDLDSYAAGLHNCLSLPIDDLLANGFTTRQTDVRPASSVNTAFQLIAVLFQIQSLQQFG